MNERQVKIADMRKALNAIHRELQEAESALRAVDTQRLYSALERTQHAAFDAKDLIGATVRETVLA